MSEAAPIGDWSFWSLPKVELRQESRTFAVPGHPERTFTLTLHELTVIEQAKARAYAQELVKRWATPDQRGDVRTFPGPDGLITLNEPFVTGVAMLESLQVGTVEVGANRDKIGFAELIGLSVRLPDLWEEITVWAMEFVPQETPAGNSSPASEASSSAPPVSSEGSTPTNDSTEPPVDGAETSG